MRHNIEFTKSMLENLWARRGRIKLDWLEFEEEITAILRSDMSDYDKVRASKELLDAFSRRGHFDPADYLTAPIVASTSTGSSCSCDFCEQNGGCADPNH